MSGKFLKVLSKKKRRILIKEICAAAFVHSMFCVIGFLFEKLNKGSGIRRLTRCYDCLLLLRLWNRVQMKEMSVNFETMAA